MNDSFINRLLCALTYFPLMLYIIIGAVHSSRLRQRERSRNWRPTKSCAIVRTEILEDDHPSTSSAFQTKSCYIFCLLFPCSSPYFGPFIRFLPNFVRKYSESDLQSHREFNATSCENPHLFQRIQFHLPFSKYIPSKHITLTIIVRRHRLCSCCESGVVGSCRRSLSSSP